MAIAHAANIAAVGIDGCSTHGDQGPGNYLDTGTTGKLIEWEQAQTSPIGLGLAR